MEDGLDLNQVFIDDLGLAKHTLNALKRGGVLTVGRLKQLLQANQLQEIHLIGAKSLEEISAALHALNEHLPEVAPIKKTLGDMPAHALPKSTSPDSNVLPIEALGLRPSVTGSLKRSGIRTIDDLRKTTVGALLDINRIGPGTLGEIQQALKSKGTMLRGEAPNIRQEAIKIGEDRANIDWAEISQQYFEAEKNKYIYVLLSRYGRRTKTLEQIAEELCVTRERVRQIEEAAIIHLLKQINPIQHARFLNRVEHILYVVGNNLSLMKFRELLIEKRLLGTFGASLVSEPIAKIDPFESLICWLNIISHPKKSPRPVSLAVDIPELMRSVNISIHDSKILANIPSKNRRKIKRKVYFTGGITLKESMKILAVNEGVSMVLLEGLNLERLDGGWYSLKNGDADKVNTKIPLRIAGLKMLCACSEMDLQEFYDGLRRYTDRVYSSIAPINVVKHILPLLGFEINGHVVSTENSTAALLSRSEKAFVAAIEKNEGLASFLEIAEEFFVETLSLAAVSVTLRRSPIVEKFDDGLYKVRGTKTSWEQVESAKKRQKRFAQDEEIIHGLDGIMRIRLTVSSYAFLTGVVGAYGIRDLAGAWPVVYNGNSYGDARIEESFLWGLSRIFKNLDVQKGDRIELAFNTWNRSLCVQKVNNGSS